MSTKDKPAEQEYEGNVGFGPHPSTGTQSMKENHKHLSELVHCIRVPLEEPQPQQSVRYKTQSRNEALSKVFVGLLGTEPTRSKDGAPPKTVQRPAALTQTYPQRRRSAHHGHISHPKNSRPRRTLLFQQADKFLRTNQTGDVPKAARAQRRPTQKRTARLSARTGHPQDVPRHPATRKTAGRQIPMARPDLGPIRCLQPRSAPWVPSPAGTRPQHSWPASPGRRAAQAHGAPAHLRSSNNEAAFRLPIGPRWGGLKCPLPDDSARWASTRPCKAHQQGTRAGRRSNHRSRRPHRTARPRSPEPGGKHHKRPTLGPPVGTESGTRGSGGPKHKSSVRSPALPRGNGHLAARPGHAPRPCIVVKVAL
ncbi:hypothetical protein NDU88_001442 [Pleurodeles waltl]|uniref:Uncharacterized protein n=1 Tax=Pleurodeles waltl TaxID=8319 RepID=A0AAV7V7T8_PLEWA|nr:hypothetical protein NDU88_001442 [Pleurodeles waltl]